MKIRIKIVKLVRIIIVTAATTVSILVALSINTAPSLGTVDIVRIKTVASATHGVGEVRFGIWNFCLHTVNGTTGNLCDIFSPCDVTGTLRLCSKPKYGYTFSMTKPGQPVVQSLGSNWTRAMPLHVAVAVLMSISFILTLIPGRYAKILRLCFYALTLVICLGAFFFDFAITYHIKNSLIKSLSTLGVASSSLDGPGMVIQIGASAALFVEFIFEYVEDADKQPVVYPILPTGQGNTTTLTTNTREGWRKRFLKPTGAKSWRGLRESFAKRIKDTARLRRSSRSNGEDGGSSELPQPTISSPAPRPKVFAHDKELKQDMKGRPGVNKKASSYPNLNDKPPRQMRL